MSNALRPDWLRRLLSAVMAEPTASVTQLARRLGLRASEVTFELDVFYRTELHQLPIQWWAPLARVLTQEAPIEAAPPSPAPEPEPVVPMRPLRRDRVTCRAEVRVRRATTKAAKRPKPRRLSIDEIFARELANARRTMHVNGWDQRGSA